MKLQAESIGKGLTQFVEVKKAVLGAKRLRKDQAFRFRASAINAVKTVSERFERVRGLRHSVRPMLNRARVSLEKEDLSQAVREAHAQLEKVIAYSLDKLSEGDKKLLYSVLPEEFKK